MSKELSNVVKSLEPHVKDFCKGCYPTDGFFNSILKAAIAKSYEFCLFTTLEEGKLDAFFYTATLRGICEDLISLKYYYSFDVEDRETVIKYMAVIDMAENVRTQAEFFNSNKPTQPVVKKILDDSQISLARGEIGNLKGKYKWKSSGYRPSTREMAKSCNLLKLYDYFYAATSRWVHFSPHILTRMGWGDMNENGEIDASYSTSHFSGYYASFNCFYATYLFVLECKLIKKEISFNSDAWLLVEKLEKELLDTARWPELVTFEEMNIKPPSQITYILAHIAGLENSEQKMSMVEE
ncbi:MULTISPECIES: DUF5677 domain-containing protein [Trichocoleus]|uniref:DUF5677 domain-containing protein n=1 Tax=Trichocoleus desertorum GB2-A4 TaxID=2933944 RepID=A0ABV0JE32_9CYAN|nr:DUF5677 domain-containing protein [Trichocoleus sp. FACHB-46]MBD1862983.1 hypothetical protein [Trichocoleus sp. FACHB-46]